MKVMDCGIHVKICLCCLYTIYNTNNCMIMQSAMIRTYFDAQFSSNNLKYFICLKLITGFVVGFLVFFLPFALALIFIVSFLLHLFIYLFHSVFGIRMEHQQWQQNVRVHGWASFGVGFFPQNSFSFWRWWIVFELCIYLDGTKRIHIPFYCFFFHFTKEMADACLK